MQPLATPDELLAQLSKKIQTLLKNKAMLNPLMVGIQTGGVWVASRLHQHASA